MTCLAGSKEGRDKVFALKILRKVDSEFLCKFAILVVDGE